MHVALIAWTVVADRVRERLGAEPGVTDIDLLAEYAGRGCYESWSKPNPLTRTNAGYLSNIRNHRHFSVFEHGNATFELEGVSLALMWELTRHRHMSYSIRSTRYCPPKDFAVHPTLNRYGLKHKIITDIMDDVWEKALDSYEQIFNLLRDNGESLKVAREAAAQVLPVMTSTVINVTGNMRAWRELIEKRNTSDANAEIRECAQLILMELKRVAPNTFADMSADLPAVA